MSLKSEAKEQARKFIEDIARGLIRDAIEYRRTKPCEFAKFHQIMQEKLRKARRPNGKRLIAWRARVAKHRYWEMFYAARCEAFDPDFAKKCGVCSEDP